jgi:hypothetical protein
MLFLLLGCATSTISPDKGGETSAACDTPEIDRVCTEQGQDELYTRYVEPLVTGGQPSSCNQCHLSGVDLSMYVRDTPCASMACMVESGMVDLDNPVNSEVLAQIMLADPASSLIDGAVIDREYEGFLAWIEWSASCQVCVCGELEDPCGTGSVTSQPTGVQTPLGGTCTEEELGASFEARMWPWRDRCSSCHAPEGEGANDGAPPHWIVSGSEADPLYTMYAVIGGGYVDWDTPSDSLLLTKPLAGIVDHGGGDKLDSTSDPAYVDILAWIEEYAACRSDTDTEPDTDTDPVGAAPVVEIWHPSDGETRAAGSQIPWIGSGLDPEDGTLTAGSLVWSSSIDGVFGTGERFDAPLSVGSHLITLSGTDGDANTGTDSITIQVE